VLLCVTVDVDRSFSLCVSLIVVLIVDEQGFKN
jgi:hypothetical protein